MAYHGFSINVNTDLKKYKKIIPCGIKDKDLINLINIKNQSYKNLKKYKKIIPCGIKDKDLINLNTIKKQSYKNLKLKLIKNFIKNLKS